MSVATARGLPPMHVWAPHLVQVRDIVEETSDTRTCRLEFVDPVLQSTYSFRPGQFNMLYVPGAGESAISISGRAAADAPLLHTIRGVGNVTNALKRLGAGDTFGLRGPFGSSWPIEQLTGQDIILTAGGIGLAPLRPAIYHVLDHREDYGSITLLYGARTPEDFLYRNELAAWALQGIEVQLTVDRPADGWNGCVGVVTLLLDRLPVKDPVKTQLLCCGPEVMMSYTAVSAARHAIPPENMWISMERNMNCAIGLCGHCQLGPAFLCKDGPVLRHDRVAPFLAVKGL